MLTSNRLRFTATGLLAVPLILLLLLGVAEMVGGDVGGAQHLVEAVPLLVLVVAGWRYPRATGYVLLGLGAVLLVAWFVIFAVDGRATGAEVAGVAAVLFAPPMIAGWLLLRSARAAP